jgi:dTDP-glucose 4,6-dehydratase/UDP-glucose 4-epimerase
LSKHQKILILGCNGFIGTNLVNYFSGASFHVEGCDLYPTENINFRFHNLSESNVSLESVLQSQQFDFCINAAGNGNVNFSVSQPDKDFGSNVTFTFHLLELLRIHAPQCKFLHISSAAVYGNPEVLPVKEGSGLHPVSPYGWHKMISEQICSEYFILHGIQSAIIRPFSVYGPGLKKQIFWDVYKKSKEDIQKIELWGNGSEARDFIFITDLMRAIHAIMDAGIFQAETYNVASGEMTFIKDAVEIFLNKIQIKKSIFFNGIHHEGNPFQWQADISKLQSLGFVTGVSIEEGLTALSNWIKTQQIS